MKIINHEKSSGHKIKTEEFWVTEGRGEGERYSLAWVAHHCLEKRKRKLWAACARGGGREGGRPGCLPGQPVALWSIPLCPILMSHTHKFLFWFSTDQISVHDRITIYLPAQQKNYWRKKTERPEGGVVQLYLLYSQWNGYEDAPASFERVVDVRMLWDT